MRDNRFDELATTIEKYFKEKVDSINVSVAFADQKYARSVCRISLRRHNDIGRAISFTHMKWVSELLHTDKINIEDDYHHSGCDTCDYGAYDEADMVCYDIDPFKENSNDEE